MKGLLASLASILLPAAGMVLVSGCAANLQQPAPLAEAEPTSAVQAPPSGPEIQTQTTTSQMSDLERLRLIAAERAGAKAREAYLIGPGDLLEINVFDLPELSRKVRVSTSGFIQLPLIGGIKAAGLSEADLASEIARHLSTNYLQDPQVGVFVDEYKSQQVAVTGSVAKPGLYPLTRERYTILDMLSEAGGLTKEAGPVVEFIPAVPGRTSAAFDAATAGGRIPAGVGSAEGGVNPGADGISIDLNDLLRGGTRDALNLPVVAGDVIYVPEAGSFTIEGWVDKPGTYLVTRGMSVLAALSAGGGQLFPSRLGRVEILRAANGDQSGREVQVVDLDAIRDAREPDVLLRAGDIVRVPAWKTLMIPWGFYTFIKSLISVGASIPIL